jgi:hypothetical protein
MIDIEAVRARHAEAESDGRCGDNIAGIQVVAEIE